jgi:endonuclease/exonuclease/phosphatase family metal-dependent hydrolase
MRSARTLTAALLLLAGCDPFHTKFADVEDVRRYEARIATPAPPAAGAIRVMTWNLKFGGARLRFFWECRGSRSLMTEDEVRAHLDEIAERIRAAAPDVVLLQEIDTDRSKRVAYLDEVQYVLDRSGLSHAVYASAWKADYVPTDGLGPIDSGNAILSRWPIGFAVRHALPLRTDISALERYFYLRRNAIEARVDVAGSAPLWIVAIHAEAFGKDGTKLRHLERLKALMDAHAAAGERVVGGGDLNEIPPTSMLRSAFPEDAGCTGEYEGDDYSGEETWLDPLYAAYAPDVTPAAFGADPGSWYTFVGDEAFPLDRKLDHLFTNGRWRDAQVLQDAVLLSDHVPVVADLEVP